MWQKRSLRARINVLVALVLTLGLAINIARLVIEAGPRVQAEDQSVVRLTSEFIQTIVTSLNDAPDLDARLDKIVRDLSRLRHVSIARQGGDGSSSRQPDHIDDNVRSPPVWFVALVHPATTSVSVPVAINGTRQSLVITSHPDDEMAEIWDGIVTQLLVGSVIAIVLFLVTTMVIGRALKPLQALSKAMTDIEAGRYETRVAPDGAPELAAICTKLNHLAGALGDAIEDKRQLAERAVSLQDKERKDIARELHDEFGPHLFALRAHAGALMRLSETSGPSPDALRKHGAAVLAQTDALQQFNRRILEKLRPVGLAELGLREALGVQMRLWREAYPGVVIETSVPSSFGSIGEAADLTIYRVVQEALTNAFRHGRATAVTITVDDPEERASAGEDRRYAVVRVRDNGCGLDPDHRPGLGLVGMRERVWAQGGTLTIASGETGVSVEARVPKALAL